MRLSANGAAERSVQRLASIIAPCVFYLRTMPESGEMLEAHSNLMRAMAAIDERPSFAETMPPPPPS